MVVVGGTHGNEFTGVWEAQRLQRAGATAWPTLHVEALLGNPMAHRGTRRFVDDDLNRQFGEASLRDVSLAGYEAQRAKTLAAHFGYGYARDGMPADFVIDLHTTTTNMGITFITERWSPFGIAAASWCRERLEPRVASGELPEVRILLEPDDDRRTSPHVISMGRDGLEIEIGPVPQGVLLASACRWMQAATETVMEFLHAFNTGRVEMPQETVLYHVLPTKVAAPTGADGWPTALFHEAFQGKDYQPLRRGDPVFQGMSGEVTAYDGKHGDVVWPVFVNEAAYYLPQSGLGFCVTDRKEGQAVPRFRVSRPMA